MIDDDINCTRFWELPQDAQDEIVAIVVTEYAEGATCWGHWGNKGEPARCRKCGFYRLRHNKNDEHWCRRCRYIFYDEYFGDEGYNTLWVKYFYDASLDNSSKI